MPDELSQDDIDALLASGAGAQSAASSDKPKETGAASAPAPLQVPDFGAPSSGASAASPPSTFDLLMDVNMNVKIEVGKCRMLVEDILRLKEGSVVTLDKMAGDPVDILVNERLVARGDVMVINDVFCVRVTEILDPKQRLMMLR